MKKNSAAKTIALTAALLLALTLFSCQDNGEPSVKGRDEVTYDTSKAEVKYFTAEPRENNGVWYCNRFLSAYAPPFALPDGAKNDGGYYSFEDMSSEEYGAFLKSLQDDGFALVRLKYDDFLFRDDCMVFPQYRENERKLNLIWYRKSPYAPADGISFEKADELLDPYGEESLSKIALHPIDVTPKGFYELTGAQIFAMPSYSYDKYKAAGSDDLMFDDNEWYNCTVCYVKGNTVKWITMESVAVDDIDGDGANDVLLLSYGPTSGLFTFCVEIITEKETYYSTFNTGYMYLGFAEKDGKIVIEGGDGVNGTRCFDIALSGSGPYVELYCNGDPVPTWGVGVKAKT